MVLAPINFPRTIPVARSRAACVMEAPRTGRGVPIDKHKTNDNTMKKTYYIGLDVHSQNTAIAHAIEGGREDPVVYGSCGGSVQNVERTLRRLSKSLEVDFKDLKVSYEAGPTGFVLARRLIGLGVESKVWHRLPAARLRLRIEGCNCCDHFDSERVAGCPAPPCSLERFVGNARFHLGCDGSGGGETGGPGKIRWKRSRSK